MNIRDKLRSDFFIEELENTVGYSLLSKLFHAGENIYSLKLKIRISFTEEDDFGSVIIRTKAESSVGPVIRAGSMYHYLALDTADYETFVTSFVHACVSSIYDALCIQMKERKEDR